MIWLKLDSCRDWVLSIVLKLHVQVSVCVHSFGRSGPSSCFLRFMFVFLRWFSQMEPAGKGPWHCFFPGTCCQGRDCGVSVRLDGGWLKNCLTSIRSDSADTWPTFRFASWFTQLKVRVVLCRRLFLCLLRPWFLHVVRCDLTTQNMTHLCCDTSSFFYLSTFYITENPLMWLAKQPWVVTWSSDRYTSNRQEMTLFLCVCVSDCVLHSYLPLRGPHHPAGSRRDTSWSLWRHHVLHQTWLVQTGGGSGTDFLYYGQANAVFKRECHLNINRWAAAWQTELRAKKSFDCNLLFRCGSTLALRSSSPTPLGWELWRRWAATTASTMTATSRTHADSSLIVDWLSEDWLGIEMIIEWWMWNDDWVDVSAVSTLLQRCLHPGSDQQWNQFLCWFRGVFYTGLHGCWAGSRHLTGGWIR